jgi:ankyrin repeat protein/L-ascorbate metabolism protein UlaG (beta-lactamase superfamily)
MKTPLRRSLLTGLAGVLLAGSLFGQALPQTAQHAPNVLVLLGEWFGDAYFPLAKEIEARGWTLKRVGVEAEYRGCYNKSRDVVLRSDILIPDLKDFSGYDCLIIPSGPQFRIFQKNPDVLDFIRKAHASGLLVASFCVGNDLVQAAGLVDGLTTQETFPKAVTLAGERVLIGPRGGGPPPGDGFESAPIRELCDAVARELASGTSPTGPPQDVFDLLRKGDVAAVKALVERTPGLAGARDDQGQTLLHYAAYGQDRALVELLIDKGAKVDLAGAQAKTPLHIAAMNDRREIVAALLKGGASLEIRDDYARTALILCARERGGVATARVLLEAGADINAADKFGSTALELAAWRGKEEFVALLLDKGASVPEKGDPWQTLLMESVSNGLGRLFRRLTEAGQDLKALDPAGDRLLQAAAAGGSAEIVGLLVEKGYSPAKADRFGWTPLHYAARDGRTEVARILLGRGAPLEARTLMGQTAYNVAVDRKMEAVAALLAGKGADRSETRFPVLKGDYLGQKPPGEKSELFGPGIISSIWGLHSTAVFSPEGDEVYWAPMVTYPGEVYSRGGLLMMKRVKGLWTAPAWASFSGPSGDDDVPFFSADGKRLYFISRRPLPGETQRGEERIWYTDRAPDGWAEPKPLDPNVNSVHKHWEFSLDREGNLYFAGRPPDSRGASDIYVARLSNGAYEKPFNLGDPINTPGIEDTPFVAPDGSYLLFSRQFDLWVSFRGPNGAWGEPIKLGPEVNSPSIELCPMVTADGKYLFFLSQRDGESHAYWVGAGVIEKLRPGERTDPAAAAQPLELTYLANMGVLLSCGETKVLVDALFDEPNPEYRAPSPQTIEAMIKGGAPFDGVDLVLVTHDHPDHFDAALAARYLEARPEALLAAPADAVEAMRRAAGDWAKVGPRVIPFDLEVGEKEERVLKGVALTACRTLHSGNRDAPMNLMYVIELDGRRVWHEGDTDGRPETFKAFGLERQPFDLAVVHFYLPLEPNAARFLQEDLQAGHIALAHLPIRLEGDAPAKIELVRAHYKDLVLLLPGTAAKTLRQ